MRIMGLDLGTKTIGVAVSDETRVIAQPVATIIRSGMEADLTALMKYVSDYSVAEIVVGMPVNMDGSIGGRALAADRFMEMLRTRTALPVTAWDERLSTVAVTRMLIEGDMSREKRKKVVDKLAASYILQGYLDGIGSASSAANGDDFV